MKKVFYIIAALFILSSCQKEDPQPYNGSGSGSGTNTTQYGTVYFKNTQSDPYKIFIDGNYKINVLAGSTSSGYTVIPGIIYNIKAEQATGYILYPTIFTGTAITNPGGSVTWTF